MFEISDYVIAQRNTIGNHPLPKKGQLKQLIRKIADILMPYGTVRREVVKVAYKKIRRII